MVERGAALDRAKEIINGERQDCYGSPEDNFSTIAEYWNLYCNSKDFFEPHDVAMLMALLKIARIQTGVGDEDSYIDALGYIALAADMRAEEREE